MTFGRHPSTGQPLKPSEQSAFSSSPVAFHKTHTNHPDPPSGPLASKTAQAQLAIKALKGLRL